jgi:mRNA-degrading endonuclease toxin of MazEF toxin-antitoxin module
MKRGEVRWYKFKEPDKKRPVLILTRDSILEYLGEVTVAAIISRLFQRASLVVLLLHSAVRNWLDSEMPFCLPWIYEECLK